MKTTYEEPPWTDVNEATTEAQAEPVADAPMSPLEEIKRKYGPDILRPASQLPRKAAA